MRCWSTLRASDSGRARFCLVLLRMILKVLGDVLQVFNRVVYRVFNGFL